MTDLAYIHYCFIRGNIRPFYSDMYADVILYAIKILGDDCAFMAEDCVQDAVLTTYTRRHELDSPGSWKAFLLTCVRYNAIAVLRKDSYHKHFLKLSDSENSERDSSFDLIEHEVHMMLYSVIDSLPEKYREIFDLSFEQGMRNAEVANLLKIAEITVKKRKATLIELIRAKLGNQFNENIIMALVCSRLTADGVANL